MGERLIDPALRAKRGMRLRAARAKSGISARELVTEAEKRSRGRFSLCRDSIYQYEHGRSLLTRRVASQFAPILGVSVGFLLGREEVTLWPSRVSEPKVTEPTAAEAPEEEGVNSLEDISNLCWTRFANLSINI